MAVISSAMSFADWTFEKARPASKASDEFSDDTRIRIQPDAADSIAPEQDAFQERYLSSEEDLSPIDSDFDDTLSLGGEEPEIMEASVIQPVAVGKARIAMMVSVQSARPMMVQIPKPQPSTRPVRSSSLKRAVNSVASVAHAAASVPLLKAPTPRKHQLATVRNASSPGSSPELGSSPEIPDRSPQRPNHPRLHRAPTAPSYLERDEYMAELERTPAAPPVSKPFGGMVRGLGRSLSITKKTPQPLRKAPTMDSMPMVHHDNIPASAAKPQMVAREASTFERPPLPADNHDYGTPRARRQLRRRRSTLSLIVV
jgi:hypothetical protein